MPKSRPSSLLHQALELSEAFSSHVLDQVSSPLQALQVGLLPLQKKKFLQQQPLQLSKQESHQLRLPPVLQPLSHRQTSTWLLGLRRLLQQSQQKSTQFQQQGLQSLPNQDLQLLQLTEQPPPQLDKRLSLRTFCKALWAGNESGSALKSCSPGHANQGETTAWLGCSNTAWKLTALVWNFCLSAQAFLNRCIYSASSSWRVAGLSG